MKFKARTSENRKLEMKWDLVDAYLSRMKPGTFLDVEIVRRKKTVSNPLRKYYFAAVLPGLMEATGYEPEDHLMVHHFLKGIFFQCKQDSRGIYRNVPSVFSNNSKIAVPEKVAFVEWVKRKAAEHGKYIEDPQ